jgi:ATP-dependent Lon protease
MLGNKKENEVEVSILTLKNSVLYPGTVVPLLIGRDKSMKLVEDAIKKNTYIGVVAQKDIDNEDPTAADLYTVGTLAKIIKFSKNSDGHYNVMIEGVERFTVERFTEEEPFFKASIKSVPMEVEGLIDEETHILFETLKESALDVIAYLQEIPTNVADFIERVEEPGNLADIVAGNMAETVEEKQEILETFSIHDRIMRALELIGRKQEMLYVSNRIQNQVKEEISRNQKEYYLRQQLKAIKDELGDAAEDNEDLEALKQKMLTIDLPDDVVKVMTKEIKKMRNMQTSQAEYNVTLNHLELLLDLPWDVKSRDSLDLTKVQERLDADHYGLEKVKKRIIEYLAVRKLKDDMRGPILCLLGPPGVGKTSLGRSIAAALGRKFNRISLGGVADESEIRGHRKTYIGAMPGKIIKGMTKVGVTNPLILLDEIDKMGKDHKGDPAAAMLEVLDPEQNNTFVDHYVDSPYDLSDVLFIATANDIGTVPGPLRDRMEIISLSGYTYEEKLNIAKNHLIPKQKKANGLEDHNLKIRDEAINKIILGYTREAGVRGLEREISRVCRVIAAEVAVQKEKTPDVPFAKVVTEHNLVDYLEEEKFDNEVDTRAREPGVSTGLAWTAAGGDVLYIETSKAPGKGQLQLTGKIGEVMSESAKMALSLVRAKAHSIGVAEEGEKFLENTDVHVHFPAGAVPKDGPSAGVTITTALVSLFTGRKVRTDTAMTGETSLRGLVLPVGGIKEKVIAAHRAGIKRVLLPPKNKKDVKDIPESVRNDLELFFPETVEEVLELALEK